MVEHPNGGVLFIIGFEIYLLPHAGPTVTWQLLPQRLAINRQWFTAFLIPDKLANCTRLL